MPARWRRYAFVVVVLALAVYALLPQVTSLDASLLVVGWLPSLFNSLVLVGFALLGLVQLIALRALSRLEIIAFSFSAACSWAFP